MIKNKLIVLLFVFFVPHATFSYQFHFLHEIKANLDMLKNRFFPENTYKELCKENLEIVSDHTLGDVIGMKDVKKELKDIIKSLMNLQKNPHLIKEKISQAFLVHGWRRSGKTFLIEGFIGSLQKESKNNIKALNIPTTIIQKYGITAVLKYIKYHTPAIIYIDEVNLIGLKRNTNSTMFSDFLTALTALLDNPEKPIIIFCAMNEIENLPCLGNLGKEIHCEYPNFEERRIVIERKFKKFNINPTEFDLDFLAHACKDAPYEKINYILYTALMVAGKQGVPLSQNILEKIIQEECFNIIRTPKD